MNVVCLVPIPYIKLVTSNSSCLVARIIITKPFPAPVIPSLLHFHFILYMFNCDCPSNGLQIWPFSREWHLCVIICLPLTGSAGVLNFGNKELIYVEPVLPMFVLPLSDLPFYCMVYTMTMLICVYVVLEWFCIQVEWREGRRDCMGWLSGLNYLFDNLLTICESRQQKSHLRHT